MADMISQVKLPNGSTYDIRDEYAHTFIDDLNEYVNELFEDSDDKASQILALNAIINVLQNKIAILEGYHTADSDDVGTSDDRIVIQDGQMYWGKNIVTVTDGIKFSHM